MLDFADARRKMVDGQIRPADVTDLRVCSAMLSVPREQFVPQTDLAYLDIDVPLGKSGRRMLQPVVIGRLLQNAALKATDRVLDVGCGTGYSAALLAELAGEVVALEEDAALAREAEKNLAGRAKVVTGPLTHGAAASAPYDFILMNGATEIVPQMLFTQLADGGRLACVLGAGRAGRATLYVRSGKDVGSRPLFDAAAPLLPGFGKAPAFVF